MTHRHEWTMVFIYGKTPYAGCLYHWDQDDACAEKLDVGEIQRRLNATEHLSAEDADYLYEYIPHEFVLQKNKDKLKSYARALEGSDE